MNALIIIILIILFLLLVASIVWIFILRNKLSQCKIPISGCTGATGSSGCTSLTGTTGTTGATGTICTQQCGSNKSSTAYLISSYNRPNDINNIPLPTYLSVGYCDTTNSKCSLGTGQGVQEIIISPPPLYTTGIEYELWYLIASGSANKFFIQNISTCSYLAVGNQVNEYGYTNYYYLTLTTAATTEFDIGLISNTSLNSGNNVDISTNISGSNYSLTIAYYTSGNIIQGVTVLLEPSPTSISKLDNTAYWTPIPIVTPS